MLWCHWWCHQCHLMPMSASIVSHDQKSHVATHFHFTHLRNAVVPLMMPILAPMASHNQQVTLHLILVVLTNEHTLVPLMMLISVPLTSYDQKCHVVTHFNHCELRNVWCHWWCCLHLVTPMAVQVALHDQKSHIATHFNYLDLRNGMVSLVVSLASCDAHASANGVTWLRIMLHCMWTSRPKEYNVWLVMLLASCDGDTNASAITCQRSHIACHLIVLTWECNSSLHDPISIMWC